MRETTYEAIQQTLLGYDEVREPVHAQPPDAEHGTGLLDDRETVARLRTSAPSRRHFCLQAGLEPGPVSYARVNAALQRFHLPLYPAGKRHAA